MGSYFGMTAEELAVLPEAACSGGFEKIWRAWQGFISQEIENVKSSFAAEAATAAAGPQDDASVAADSSKWVCTRRARSEREVRELERLEGLRAVAPPMWRIVSGLDANERAMSPGLRATGIRRLLKSVERIARTELRAEDSRRGGDWRKVPAMRSGAEASDAEADITDVEDRRCYAWDPLRSITFYLGIARTKLGAYAWELWGLSATQLIDRVKCESVRGKIRVEMQSFAREFLKDYAGSNDDAAAGAWAAFRASRGGVAYRSSLAAKFGYSSYAKFSRACLLCFGMEPSELERSILEEVVLEILTEPSGGSGTPQGAEVERGQLEGGRQNAEGGGEGMGRDS